MVAGTLFQIRLNVDDDYQEMVKDMIKVTCLYFIGVIVHVSAFGGLTRASERFALEMYALALLGLSFYHLIFKLLVSLS
jgi:hypothetical protein